MHTPLSFCPKIGYNNENTVKYPFEQGEGFPCL